MKDKLLNNLAKILAVLGFGLVVFSTITSNAAELSTVSLGDTQTIGPNKIGLNDRYVSYENVGNASTETIQGVINSGTVSASITSFNPDDNQTTYFAGHNPGVFNTMAKQIRLGAIITVTDSDGTAYNYKVTDYVSVDVYGEETLSTIGITANYLYGYGSGEESIAIQYCNKGKDDMSVWYAVKQ